MLDLFILRSDLVKEVEDAILFESYKMFHTCYKINEECSWIMLFIIYTIYVLVRQKDVVLEMPIWELGL